MPQVAEERALSGYCGSPMCMRELSRSGGKLRRKLNHSTYCRCVVAAFALPFVHALSSTQLPEHVLQAP